MTSVDLEELERLAKAVCDADARNDGLALSAALDAYDYAANAKAILSLITALKSRPAPLVDMTFTYYLACRSYPFYRERPDLYKKDLESNDTAAFKAADVEKEAKRLGILRPIPTSTAMYEVIYKALDNLKMRDEVSEWRVVNEADLPCVVYIVIEAMDALIEGRG